MIIIIKTERRIDGKASVKELAELLKEHIYREDNIILPLAQELLTKEELRKFYD